MNVNIIKELLNKLLLHKGIRRYGANTLWLIIEKILKLFLGLFVNVWIARYLQPSQFGVFNYVQSIVYFFIVFTSLGLDTIVIRELVKDNYKANTILGSVFILKLIAAFTILPFLYMSYLFISDDSEISVFIMIMALAPILQSFSVIDFYYQAKVQSKYVAIANILLLCLSSILKIVLIYLEAPLISFVWVTVVEATILSILFVYFYCVISKNNLFEWKFDRDIAKKILIDSIPMLFSGLLIAVYAKTDQIMISHMLDNRALGYYSSAVKLTEVWSVLPAVLCASLYPAIINAKLQSQEMYKKRLSLLYSLMIWMSLLACFFITLFNKQIIIFTFGSDYLGAQSSLLILAWSNLFIFFTTVWSRYMLVENNQKEVLYFDCLAVFFNIMLNILLIPDYGIIGASIATAISVPLAHLVIFVFWKKQRYIIHAFLNAIIFRF